jgi:ferredoxin
VTAEPDVRPVVDRGECFGFGYCADLLPAVFQVDATGHSVVIGFEADAALLARAVDDCPRGAIDLVRVGRE